MAVAKTHVRPKTRNRDPRVMRTGRDENGSSEVSEQSQRLRSVLLKIGMLLKKSMARMIEMWPRWMCARAKTTTQEWTYIPNRIRSITSSSWTMCAEFKLFSGVVAQPVDWMPPAALRTVGLAWRRPNFCRGGGNKVGVMGLYFRAIPIFQKISGENSAN